MYIRLCTVDQATLAARISFLLETQGLHPFTVCLPAPESTGVARLSYSIELPPDEIEKGRKVHAVTASKTERGSAQ